MQNKKPIETPKEPTEELTLPEKIGLAEKKIQKIF